MGFIDKKKRIKYFQPYPFSEPLQPHYKVAKRNTTHNSYLLSVGDNDDQYGGDTADNDDNCQSQQRPLCVAYTLHSFLYAGHHVRGSDLQNPSARREEGLELLIDVQEFTIKKPWEEKCNNATETVFIWQ